MGGVSPIWNAILPRIPSADWPFTVFILDVLENAARGSRRMFVPDRGCGFQPHRCWAYGFAPAFLSSLHFMRAAFAIENVSRLSDAFTFASLGLLAAADVGANLIAAGDLHFFWRGDNGLLWIFGHFKSPKRRVNSGWNVPYYPSLPWPFWVEQPNLPETSSSRPKIAIP